MLFRIFESRLNRCSEPDNGSDGHNFYFMK